MTTISIPEGVKVLRDDSQMVALRGSVMVEAERQADGGFEYAVAGRRYYVSAGCCSYRDGDTVHEAQFEAPAFTGPVRHRDGLVWIG